MLKEIPSSSLLKAKISKTISPLPDAHIHQDPTVLFLTSDVSSKEISISALSLVEPAKLTKVNSKLKRKNRVIALKKDLCADIVLEIIVPRLSL